MRGARRARPFGWYCALALVVGAAAWSCGGSPTAPQPPPNPTPQPPPPSTPSAPAVLVGAGDIAVCGDPGSVATAKLLDRIPEGQVFAAGDNAYMQGTPQQFRDCYDPTWGRHKDRTWPVAGNHDWGTRGLAGYREYFGAAAGAAGTSWYAKDLGTWRIIVLDSDCSKVGGCDADSVQGRWLADELATHR